MSLEVDPSTRAVLERHLWAGENLLWGERPSDAGPLEVRAAWRGANTAAAGGTAVLAVVLLYLSIAHVIHFPLSDAIAYGFPVSILVIAGLGAIAGWWRARRMVPDTVYGLTTRRVLIARGDSVEWIGDKELEGVELRGGGVVVTRRRAEIEYQWAPDELSQDSGARLARAQELDRRQLALVSLRDPAAVERLIRVTLRP